MDPNLIRIKSRKEIETFVRAEMMPLHNKLVSELPEVFSQS